MPTRDYDEWEFFPYIRVLYVTNLAVELWVCITLYDTINVILVVLVNRVGTRRVWLLTPLHFLISNENLSLTRISQCEHGFG